MEVIKRRKDSQNVPRDPTAGKGSICHKIGAYRVVFVPYWTIACDRTSMAEEL